MTSGSYARQPGNLNAYDFHAYYGGGNLLKQQGISDGRVHRRIQNGSTVFHRVPVERGFGQISVSGSIHA